MARAFRRAVLGGTFDRLHPGHRALLAEAFAAADEVHIGLTTTDYLRRHPKPFGAAIGPYRARREALVRFLRARFPGRRWRIVPLSDPFGGSLRLGPDLLVVSTSTRRGAWAVNRERRRLGRPPLALRVVRLVRDRSGRPYSSRRRRALERSARRPGRTNR